MVFSYLSQYNAVWVQTKSNTKMQKEKTAFILTILYAIWHYLLIVQYMQTLNSTH